MNKVIFSDELLLEQDRYRACLFVHSLLIKCVWNPLMNGGNLVLSCYLLVFNFSPCQRKLFKLQLSFFFRNSILKPVQSSTKLPEWTALASAVSAMSRWMEISRKKPTSQVQRLPPVRGVHSIFWGGGARSALPKLFLNWHLI